jgi:hypothetical protein
VLGWLIFYYILFLMVGQGLKAQFLRLSCFFSVYPHRSQDRKQTHFVLSFSIAFRVVAIHCDRIRRHHQMMSYSHPIILSQPSSHYLMDEISSTCYEGTSPNRRRLIFEHLSLLTGLLQSVKTFYCPSSYGEPKLY